MTYKTPTSKLTPRRIRHICDLVMDWCVDTYGIKKKGVPFLRVTTFDGSTFGEYDDIDHEIFIYHNNCRTVRVLIQTMIHEYTHSIQKGMRSYSKLSKENGYWNNPLEIEARSKEKDWKQCYGDCVSPYLRRVTKL